MEKEIWKPIPTYDNAYEASNHGNIRKTGASNFLKYEDSGKDYLAVNLHKPNGDVTSWRIHFLIATVFVTRYEGQSLIHHLDGNKKNNRADNLLWV